MRFRPAPCLLAAVMAAACSSPPAPVHDPAIEDEFLGQRSQWERSEAQRQNFQAELILLDKALDKYAGAWLTNELQTSERLQEQLETYLRQTVARHYGELMAAADDRQVPANRTIALAALGFSGRGDVLDTLLNGARDDNVDVAVAALLGLAILRDSRTPAAVLGGIVLDHDRAVDVRRNASLALLRCQDNLFDPTSTQSTWRKVLEQPLDAEDMGVQLHAIRGLGALRTGEDAALVAAFVSHPQPKLRAAAAIALGRMGNVDSVPALLALLSPTEKNDNVRLAARKALQELAGGVDRYYDAEAWRKVFARTGG